MEAFTFSTKGDRGETSLLTGQRVSKASCRPEAYGTLDEASSVLGLVKVFTENEKIREMAALIQEDLVLVGAELSCEGGADAKYRVETDKIARLEQWIAALQDEVPLPRRFIYPGVNPPSAFLDLARTVIRRAERNIVALRESGCEVRPELSAYMNRLADLLFTLARYAEKKG